VAEAIRTLTVRGAPAIGVAAAFGVVLGVRSAIACGRNPRAAVESALDRLAGTRPTAVNLFYALDRMREAARRTPRDADLEIGLLKEAQAVLGEDLETGRRIAEAGLALFPAAGEIRVLTHCNAGGLATSGWGTALAPIYAAWAAGRAVRVFADETRPLLQGSRLTAWELGRAGIPVTVLVDGAAASLLHREPVDLVVVGADRIAANGDTANKIGTLAVALAARETGTPFYVAAPVSTFDFSIPDGTGIPIEERSPDEVLGDRGAPGASVYNPAFDVTPARLVTAWITDRGVVRPPFETLR
jgi:methylthioribose-1-phosphate isomerase